MAKVGRPVKYKTKEELIELINKYFDKCEKNKEPLTMTGLALAVGLSRQGLLEYKRKSEFSDTIKKARDIVQEYVEKYLFTGKNTTGAIFNLKNNFGWKDQKDIDLTSKGKSLGRIILPQRDDEQNKDNFKGLDTDTSSEGGSSEN